MPSPGAAACCTRLTLVSGAQDKTWDKNNPNLDADENFCTNRIEGALILM